MKILIADDSTTQRVMLQAIISQWGFEPVMAEDGQEAWEILSEEEYPPLILLDWEMPRMSGLEVCKKIRARNEENPPYVLLLTARKETDDIVEGLEAGANDYVSKPFETAELEARLKVGKRMLTLQAELNRAKEELIFQARHDVLTGLMNRRAILELLEREISRVERQQQNLFVGMCDIDYFKKINDTYGHLAGDAILKQVADRISRELRPTDGVGRYGGEEFLILVNSKPDKFAKVFERVRLCIAEKPFIFEQQEIKVSISCGISKLLADNGPMNSNELLAAADEHLYKAKEAGRNRLEFDEE